MCLKVGESLVIGDGAREGCVVVHVDKVIPGANGGLQKAMLSIHAPEEIQVAQLERVLRSLRDSCGKPSRDLQDYLDKRRSLLQQRRR